MTTMLMEQVLARVASFGAVGSAALAVQLVALRFVALDLVPNTARVRVIWWQRHVRPMLLTVLGGTACALAALLVLRTVG